MKKVPITYGGRHLGELSVSREGLYTRFSVSSLLPEEGLWEAWAVGETGELRLGVLEPGAEGATVSRKFSSAVTEPAGEILRGELRRRGEEREPMENWKPSDRPETLFRTPWLREQVCGKRGILARRTENRLLVAVPYDRSAPFPLEPAFCMAEFLLIEGRPYVRYAFDQGEWPVLSKDCKK